MVMITSVWGSTLHPAINTTPSVGVGWWANSSQWRPSPSLKTLPLVTHVTYFKEISIPPTFIDPTGKIVKYSRRI